jgi:hypothetical protein
MTRGLSHRISATRSLFEMRETVIVGSNIALCRRIASSFGFGWVSHALALSQVAACSSRPSVCSIQRDGTWAQTEALSAGGLKPQQ